MSKYNLITQEIAQEAFTDALRRRVGPGRGVAICDLAASTGISKRNIDNWRAGGSIAQGENMARLVAVFGLEFLKEVYAPSLACTEEETPEEVLTRAVDLMHEMHHRKADDGVICHKDRAALAPKLIKMGQIGEEWQSEKITSLRKMEAVA